MFVRNTNPPVTMTDFVYGFIGDIGAFQKGKEFWSITTRQDR
jgi:hypothetical protein